MAIGSGGPAAAHRTRDSFSSSFSFECGFSFSVRRPSAGKRLKHELPPRAAVAVSFLGQVFPSLLSLTKKLEPPAAHLVLVVKDKNLVLAYR